MTDRPAILTSPEQSAIVPVKPTTEMIANGLNCSEWSEGRDSAVEMISGTFSAMLAARPFPNALQEVVAYVAVLEKALGDINDIRNSIIGCQKINWSEHIYPLVAALNEAGIEGQSYPEARENVGTLIERAVAAEARVAELEARLAEAVKVIEPFARYRTADGVVGVDGKTFLRISDRHMLLSNMKNLDDLASVDPDTIVNVGHFRAARAWMEEGP